MWNSVIRDSFIGQLINTFSKGRFLPYPEQRAGYVLPDRYARFPRTDTGKRSANTGTDTGVGTDTTVTPTDTICPEFNADAGGERLRHEAGVEMTEIELDLSGRPHAEEVTVPKEVILVDWDGEDDPENPLNWSFRKKAWTVFCIMIMTTTVYMASAIWSPAVAIGAEHFGVSELVSTLGITTFVVGYGVGPLFLSPVSEVPFIGRTTPYIVTLALFTAVQLPTAAVNDIASFLVLRFIGGLVGGTPLATGGASLADIFYPNKLPYAMGVYGVASSAAPSLAPIVAAFAIQETGDWTWPFWEMFFAGLFTLVLLSFTLPETSKDTILLRKATRLRKLTGDDNLRSLSEIHQSHLSVSAALFDALVRPITMTFTEPIIIAINLYNGLIYAVMYSFFKSFPLVYGEGGYGWGLGVSTLPFLGLVIGEGIGVGGYALWNWYEFEPMFVKTKGKFLPEKRLGITVYGALLFPVTMFWFAWSAVRVHWISPVLAGTLWTSATDWIFFPFLTYLPDAYPRYAASALASNDFVRALFGAGMPIAVDPMFKDLGIAWGNSIIGFCAVAFIPIPFLLIRYGSWLREKSPISLHDSDILDQPEAPVDSNTVPDEESQRATGTTETEGGGNNTK